MDDLIERVARAMRDTGLILGHADEVAKAALAALEAGDSLGGGLWVYDIKEAGEYLVANKLQPKLRETAETMREQCAEKIESLIKEKQPGPNPRETNVPILDWPDELRALEI